MKGNFLKIFIDEEDAIKFANNVGGKMIIRYDYDVFYGLVKEFTVEY